MSLENTVDRGNFSGPFFRCFQKINSGVSEIVNRTIEIAVSVFKALIAFISFPLRYIGSKAWSIPGVILRTPGIIFRRIVFREPITKSQFFGTRNHFAKGIKLSEDEAKGFLRYVAFGLVPFRYEQDKWAAPFDAKIIAPAELKIDLKKIPGNIEVKDNAFLDKDNTFKAVVLEDENELIVTFGAMHSLWSDVPDNPLVGKKMYHKQLWSVFLNYLGGTPLFFEQGAALIEQLKPVAQARNKKIVVTGQSLGGSIASYAALHQEVKGICINSVQLGAGLQQTIGDAKLANSEALLTHIAIENDCVTNLPGTVVADLFFSVLAGVRTPGNFGKSHWVPSSNISMREAHDFPIKSFMNYIGYDRETKANELKMEDIKKSELQK